MGRRRAPARLQSTGLASRPAAQSVDSICAAGATQVLQNRCIPSQEDQGTNCRGPPRCRCSAGENEGNSRLPFSPCLHQACLVQPAHIALQDWQRLFPREAWGLRDHGEPADASMPLWDTVETTGYPRMVEAERPKHHPPFLPPSPATPPVPGLPGDPAGPLSSTPRVQPAPGPAPAPGRDNQRPPPRRALARARTGILKKGPQPLLRFLCPGLVFSIAYRLAAAVLSLQRCICTGISILKEVVTLKMETDSAILVVMSLAVFTGACCGMSLLLWTAQTMNVQELLLGLPAAELRSLRNTLALWREQAQEVQELRDEAARLAAEISTMMKEFQQMRDAKSANTGMSDWALKTPGAAIDLQKSSSRCTGFCSVFWFLCAPPRLDSFVQPDTSPGYCWPFQGSRSEVLIRLPTQIQPTAVVIQHTSKAASPPGTVSSGPRDFSVSGLDEEGEEETVLGRFTYTVKKDPPQTFPLQNGIPRAFRFLKLVIQSNWGKPGYTCIYRVQVHGKIVEANDTGQAGVEALPQ